MVKSFFFTGRENSFVFSVSVEFFWNLYRNVYVHYLSLSLQIISNENEMVLWRSDLYKCHSIQYKYSTNTIWMHLIHWTEPLTLYTVTQKHMHHLKYRKTHKQWSLYGMDQSEALSSTDYYSERASFEFQLGHRLPWLRFSIAISIAPGVSHWASIHSTRISTNSFSWNQPISRHYIIRDTDGVVKLITAHSTNK